jgi:hypothetical protein
MGGDKLYRRYCHRPSICSNHPVAISNRTQSVHETVGWASMLDCCAYSKPLAAFGLVHLLKDLRKISPSTTIPTSARPVGRLSLAGQLIFMGSESKKLVDGIVFFFKGKGLIFQIADGSDFSYVLLCCYNLATACPPLDECSYD